MTSGGVELWAWRRLSAVVGNELNLTGQVREEGSELWPEGTVPANVGEREVTR